MRQRRADEEARVFRPLPLRHLDHRHRRAAAVRAHHALGLAGRAAGVRETRRRLRPSTFGATQRLRRELRREREQVVADVARTERQQSRQLRAPLLQLRAHARRSSGSNTSVSISASSMTYAWSSTEPSGCSALARQPVTMLAPSVNSTSGRFGDRIETGLPLAEPLRRVRLRVATHLRRDLAAGEHLVAEVDRRPIGMAVERRDEEVGQERGFVQVVGHGVCPIASPRPRSNAGIDESVDDVGRTPPPGVRRLRAGRPRGPAERWSAPTPCTEWTARDVVEHVIGFHDFLLLRPLGRARRTPARRSCGPLGRDLECALHRTRGRRRARSGDRAPRRRCEHAAHDDRRAHDRRAHPHLGPGARRTATGPRSTKSCVARSYAAARASDFRRTDGMIGPEVAVAADASASDKLVALLRPRPALAQGRPLLPRRPDRP